MYDIVYYFQGENSEELKYSIRTVDMNIKWNHIYLVGDKPKWFKETSKSIYVESKNLNLQRNGLGSVAILHIKKLIDSGKCPENFLLFNDDFFIIKQIDKWVDYYRDDKDYNLKALHNHGYHKKTLRSLQYTDEKKKYNLHVPMMINKENFLILYDKWKNFDNRDIDFRTLYGNMFTKSKHKLADLKIGINLEYDKENLYKISKSSFVSTSDDSFKKGLIGEIIRKNFNQPSSIEML